MEKDNSPTRLPHYVRDYRRFVSRLQQKGLPRDQVMALAVGGEYENVGRREQEILIELGLTNGDHLVDVGCGSGRLSSALSEAGPNISYLGTDVVADLLSYASAKAAKPEWRFLCVDGLTIPEDTGKADFVVFFSVLTHITENESLIYLRDAKRVLKPRGKIVVSYIAAEQISLFSRLHLRLAYLLHPWLIVSFKNVVTKAETIRAWADAIGMRVQFLGPLIGQNVCVFRHPESTN